MFYINYVELHGGRNSVKDGNGLEAMNMLMKGHDPRRPGTRRALVKAMEVDS